MAVPLSLSLAGCFYVLSYARRVPASSQGFNQSAYLFLPKRIASNDRRISGPHRKADHVALTWQGNRSVSVEEVPDPAIQEPTDAIVRITSTAICGSDLHLYGVLGPYMHKGDVLGHEPIGIVEEVGSAVANLRRGDPRGHPVQHLLWPLLHEPPGASVTMRDHAGEGQTFRGIALWLL
jgi:hypothetical protein